MVRYPLSLKPINLGSRFERAARPFFSRFGKRTSFVIPKQFGFLLDSDYSVIPHLFYSPICCYYAGFDRSWNTQKTLIYALIALVLWLLFWIPGSIFALLVMFEIL